MAGGRGRPRRAVRHAASPSRPRCSSRSRCCAATAAATARSPSRRPGSTRPYLTPTTVLAIARARRRARLLRGAVHARRGARGRATRRRPSGSRDTATRRTVDYLVAAARAACSTRPACSPTPTRARSPQAELERLRAVSPSQGMMIETLAARLGEPGGPHHGAPDKTPARRLATLDAAGPRARPVHDRHPRRHRRDARRAHRRARRDRRRAPSARSRAGGDRPELPAEAGHAMHRAEPCPPDEFLWSIAVGPPDPARRRAPPGAAEPERRSRAAARGRHRRLGRRVAGHRSTT